MSRYDKLYNLQLLNWLCREAQEGHTLPDFFLIWDLKSAILKVTLIQPVENWLKMTNPALYVDEISSDKYDKQQESQPQFEDILEDNVNNHQ